MHPQKKRKHETIGKLGRMPQSTVDPVVVLGQRARSGLRHIGLQLAAVRIELGESRKPLAEPLDILTDIGGLSVKRVGDRGQHARKAGHPLTILGRKVGAAVKRLAVRRQEHGERPSAASGQELHGVHVDLVEVGTLLAIDFDRNKVFVHQLRNLFVLERLALHHVAPMACRIADREEDGLVLGARPRERLVAPRVPIHRIVGVLAQVGTLLVDEAVGLAPGGLVAVLVAHCDSCLPGAVRRRPDVLDASMRRIGLLSGVNHTRDVSPRKSRKSARARFIERPNACRLARVLEPHGAGCEPDCEMESTADPRRADERIDAGRTFAAGTSPEPASDATIEIFGYAVSWRAAATAVLMLAAVMFFARLGARALWASEFRWAEIAREMRLTSRYFWPTINGRVYYDKPLGSYWLVLAAARLTGGLERDFGAAALRDRRIARRMAGDAGRATTL